MAKELGRYEIWTIHGDNRYCLYIESSGDGPKRNWKMALSKNAHLMSFPEDVLKYPSSDGFNPFVVPLYPYLDRNWRMADHIPYEYLTDILNLGIGNFGFVE